MQGFVHRCVIALLEDLFSLHNFGTANRLRHPFTVSLRRTTCNNRVVLWFRVEIT